MHGSRAAYHQWRANTLADKFALEQQKVIALDIFHGVTVWVDGFVRTNSNLLETLSTHNHAPLQI